MNLLIILLIALACVVSFFWLGFSKPAGGHFQSVRNWLTSQGEGVDRFFSLAQCRFFFAPFRLGILPEEDFQKKVIEGVEGVKTAQKDQGEKLSTIEKQNKTLTDNYDNLDKRTKTAFEDLTKIKKEANNVSESLAAIKRVQAALSLERRAAFGDPLKRVLSSEENRLRINTAVRALCDPNGDHGMKAAAFEYAKSRGLDLDSTPGSTLITDELATEIYDLLESYGSYSTLGVRTVGTKTTLYPRTTARPEAKFVRKLTSRKLVPDTNKDGTRDSISVELIGVLVLAELELLEDAEIDVSTDLLGDIVEAIAFRMDHCCFLADGTNDADDGGYTGIFEGGTAVAADATRTTVGETKYTDWLKCITGVKAAVLRRSPRWWIHQQMLAHSLAVQDDNGRPIFQTALEAPSAGAIGNILGYPVNLVSAAPNTDGAGQKVAAFGEGNSYLVPVRKRVTMATSDDFAFDAVSRAFLGTARFGSGFRDSGGITVLSNAAS